MRIYLDESGDLGFDFEFKSPSRYFVITLLVCNGNGTDKVFFKGIQRTLKNKINCKATKKTIKRELKGSETTLGTKQYFYKQISDSNGWDIYSIILDKQNLYRKLGATPVHKNLYNSLARRVLEKVNFHNVSNLVRLAVDRCKNNTEVAEFNRYVADHLAGLLPLKTKLIIEHQSSFDNFGIQAVDLFCWGIFKKYESADENWYQVYKERIQLEEIA